MFLNGWRDAWRLARLTRRSLHLAHAERRRPLDARRCFVVVCDARGRSFTRFYVTEREYLTDYDDLVARYADDGWVAGYNPWRLTES